jgi:RimJ/RimL family protein N-acetyltransferase
MLPEQLLTLRLRLRPPRMDDAPAIFEGWTRDATVTRYLTWKPYRALDETSEFLARCIEAWGAAVRRSG